MPVETMIWFAITFVLFSGFVGWVVHETRSVDHRHLSSKNAFVAKADEE